MVDFRKYKCFIINLANNIIILNKELHINSLHNAENDGLFVMQIYAGLTLVQNKIKDITASLNLFKKLGTNR
jgi:hypothetical protein